MKHILIIFFIFLTNPIVRANDYDLQLWTQAVLMAPASSENSHWKYYLEYQARHSNDQERHYTALIRPAVMYSLNPHLTLALGYLWVTNNHFTNIEQRLWQQTQINESISFFDFSWRSRLEERWRQNSLTNGSDDSHVAWRWRNLFRFQTQEPWSYNLKPLFINEVFVNLNSDSNPQFSKIKSGFDQNRLFLGVTTAATKHLNVDFGYLNVLVYRPEQHHLKIGGLFLNLLCKY